MQGLSRQKWAVTLRQWRLVIVCLVSVAAAACATPSEYMGVSLRPGAADPGIQSLAMRAQAGDKQAQLDLGIAYEEGVGVAQNLGKARNLYQLAAADSGKARWIYLPSPTGGKRGRVVQTGGGLVTPGLAEAARRLGLLNASRGTP